MSLKELKKMTDAELIELLDDESLTDAEFDKVLEIVQSRGEVFGGYENSDS